MLGRMAKEKMMNNRIEEEEPWSIHLVILYKLKCDLCPGVTFGAVTQGATGTSIEKNWIGLTAGENFKLKNICCQQYRNDPWIRNIATETNHNHCVL